MWSKVIDDQMQYKNQLIRDLHPPYNGFSIVIINSCIDLIADGSGHVHEIRKKQYLQLIRDALSLNKNFPDFIFNINLDDQPEIGYFNFCRDVNSPNGQFMLPNHRFAMEDISLGIDDLPYLSNWDLVADSIIKRSSDTPFSSRKDHLYMLGLPHPGPKQDYLSLCSKEGFFHGYGYIGPPHGEFCINRWEIEKYKLLELYSGGFLGFTSKPWIEHLNYKYLLYIDGNSLSDRLRLMMCSGSPIIKIKSRYEEFYWSLLNKNINYFEFNSVSDLELNFKEILSLSDSINSAMADANIKFVLNQLNYKNILIYVNNLVLRLVENE